MTHTLSSVRRWRPGVLEEVARDVRRHVDRLEEQLRDGERSLDRLVEGWQGEAARAADDRVRTELDFGRRLRSRVELLEQAVRAGTPRLGSARSTLLARVADAEGEGFAVSDEWFVTDTRSVPLLDVAALVLRQAALDGHAQAISDALSTLSTEDSQVAFDIDNALDELRATTADIDAGLEYVAPATPDGMTAEEVADLLAGRQFQEWMRDHPDAAKEFLDAAVDQGLLPATGDYAAFVEQYWQDEALEAAGIDGDAWDPAAGSSANSDTIRQVYDYYGRLYLDHPELAWAGMANLIGPSFAGGFYDLDMLRDVARGVQDGSERLPDLPGPVDDRLRDLLGTVAGMSDSEIGFYEETLLGMQKEIFEDQASMHEAYLLGGTEETDRLAAAGLMDRDTREAWHDIASGDADRVSAGNDQLLHREQWDIIADDYDRMRERPGTGEAMTWMTTLVGAPSIPGAQGYADVFPEVVEVRTPERVGPFPMPGQLDLGEIVTPLPDGNISDATDRWALIEEDTLPAYKELLHDDPERLRELIASDFDDRVDDQRLVHHVDDIVEHLLTDWEYRT